MIAEKQNSHLHNIWFLLALCLPVAIACIDVMAISVASHNIMQDFSSPLDKTQWLLSGYTIGTAAFLLSLVNL